MKKPHFYKKLLNGDTTKEPVITKKDFDLWYDDIFNNKIKVYGTPGKSSYHLAPTTEDTHFAFLVGLQKVEEDSEEKILKDFILKQYCLSRNDIDDLVERARIVLKGKS